MKVRWMRSVGVCRCCARCRRAMSAYCRANWWRSSMCADNCGERSAMWSRFRNMRNAMHVPCWPSLPQERSSSWIWAISAVCWFDELSRQGYSWISRLREQTTFVVMHTYFDDGQTWDKLVWMGLWDTQAAYMVRMVQIAHGDLRYRYITNVLDPKRL